MDKKQYNDGPNEEFDLSTVSFCVPRKYRGSHDTDYDPDKGKKSLDAVEEKLKEMGFTIRHADDETMPAQHEGGPLMDGYPYINLGPETNSEIPIEELELTVRTYNILKHAGINAVSELFSPDSDAIDKRSRVGKKALVESKEAALKYAEGLKGSIQSTIEQEKTTQSKGGIPVDKAQDQKRKLMEMTLGELDLGTHAYMSLKHAGINTLSDLLSVNLKKMRNIGKHSFEEIEQKIKACGLELRHTVDLRKKCDLLKQIRREIAETNGIIYLTSECTNKNECTGTCPRIEAEVRYLDAELNRLIQCGKTISLSNLSLDEKLITCQYEDALPFSEKLVRVKKDGKWGLIDLYRTTILPFEYDNIGMLENGYAIVVKDNRRSSIFVSGQRVIHLEYTDVHAADKNYTYVEKNEKWGLVDVSGELIIPCIHYWNDITKVFENTVSKASSIN